MDTKKYVPYTVNFSPNNDSQTGLLEVQERQRNYDATKFKVPQTNGSISVQVASTVTEPLRLQAHFGAGSLNTGGAWTNVLPDIPASNPDRRIVTTKVIDVPVPPPGVNMHLRVVGSTSHEYGPEEYVALRVFPLPGVENIS